MQVHTIYFVFCEVTSSIVDSLFTLIINFPPCFTDMVVNLFSFSYCGLGLMLVLNSVRISNMWSQAYHLTLIEMLNSYYNLNGFVGYFPYGLVRFSLLPLLYATILYLTFYF